MLRDEDADLLLVARLDRTARDLTVQEAVLAEVRRVDAEIHACDMGAIKKDDPVDLMRTAIRQVMGALAQLDRAMLVKWLSDGRAAKSRAVGKAVGRRPYGWAASGETVPVDQHVILTVRTLRTAGLTWDDVVAEVNGRGHAWWARPGRPWARRNLAAVMR